jgi:hypothetical protein
LFTCTTYFGFGLEDKFEKACKALQSLVDLHASKEPQVLKRIHKWVLINEYDENDSEAKVKYWAKKIRDRFPFVTYIQKTLNSKGQVKSMNMILDMLKTTKLTYWIHWEESWYATRPFLGRALTIMDQNQSITQFQFSKFQNGVTDWMEVPPSRRTCSSDWCFVSPPKYAGVLQEAIFDDPFKYQFWWARTNWPLYSLRPSLNRIAHYEFAFKNGFSKIPELWPYRFEWEFARRWVKAGCVKAVFQDGPVTRAWNHVSTYDSRVAQKKDRDSTLSAFRIGVLVTSGVLALAAIIFAIVYVFQDNRNKTIIYENTS